MATHATKKKKVIVFDIDDTVADLHSFILPHLNLRCGTEHSHITHWDWTKQFGLTWEVWGQMLHDVRFMNQLNLRCGMVKYWFMTAQALGWTVHFCTHRGHLQNAEAYTKQWLECFPFMKHEKLIILKPGQLKADYFCPSTRLFFDDRPEEVEYAQSKGIKSYLIQQPWNLHSTHPNVCKTIADVQCAIQWAQ